MRFCQGGERNHEEPNRPASVSTGATAIRFRSANELADGKLRRKHDRAKTPYQRLRRLRHYERRNSRKYAQVVVDLAAVLLDQRKVYRLLEPD